MRQKRASVYFKYIIIQIFLIKKKKTLEASREYSNMGFPGQIQGVVLITRRSSTVATNRLLINTNTFSSRNPSCLCL